MLQESPTFPKKHFLNEDLRGKNFDNTDLSQSVFENCKVGINFTNKVVIFLIAAALSLFAGYIAMKSGSLVQTLIQSEKPRLQIAGYMICGFFILVVVMAVWRGLNQSSIKLATSIMAFIILIGIIVFFVDGTAAGVGALYGVGAMLCVFIMLVIGAIARATAGSLQSTILFMIVAMGGGMFAKSLGGGVGTLVMTVATVLISKKALKNRNPSLVKYIALRISTFFGTSFRNCDFTGATFKNMKVENCNFSGATIKDVKMINAMHTLCYYGKSEHLPYDTPS